MGKLAKQWFQEADLMYWKTMRRIVTASLCFSMVIGTCACKKKEEKQVTRGAVILSSDTFFDSELHELKIPRDESKELSNFFINSIEYFGEQISIQYDISYKMSDGQSDYYSQMGKSGVAVFDLEGNLLSDRSSQEEGSTRSTYTTKDKDGNIITLYSEFDMIKFEYHPYCIYRNASGEELKRIDFATPFGAPALEYTNLLVLPDNRFILRANDENGYRFSTFDESGKHLFDIHSLDLIPMSDVFQQDGKCYVLTTHRGEWLNMVSEIDMETGAIQQGKEVTQLLTPQSMVAGEDGLYSCTPNGISKYDVASNEMKEFLSWNQTDLDHGIMNEVKCYPKNENEIHAVATVYGDNYCVENIYAINLQRAAKNPHAGKQILLAGGIGIPHDFYQFAQKYNADKNHPARIETIDYAYMSGASTDSFNSIPNKIYLDVVGGTGPDILVNFAAYDQFAHGGLLVDLNPYIDGKNGLNRSDYFDNLFRAQEKDGKLFFAPLSFTLEGYMVNTDLMDVDQSLSFDKLDEAASKLPSGTSAFPKTDYASLLDRFLAQSLSEYLDYARKEVHFSSDKMVRILEEARKYGCPKEEVTTAGSTRYIALGGKYRNVSAYNPQEALECKTVDDVFYLKQCAMLDVKIPSVYEYVFYQGLAEGKAQLVGYPSVDGKGVVASPRFSLAIVNTSSHPDEAWDIVKAFYSEEAQDLLTHNKSWTGSSFPVRISTFEAESNEAVELINEAREEYQKLRKNPDFDSSAVYFSADENLPAKLKEIVTGISCTTISDTAILDIINEETNGYFVGARSAEDVLKIIDKRAKQIVQER